MKIKMIIVAMTLLCVTKVSAQAVEQGTILIDTYYGFPNLYSAIFRNLYSNQSSDIAVSGFGPIGVRGEYLIADKIGVGLDVGFNKTSLKFTDTQDVYDDATQTYTTKTYTYNYHTQKIGVMATFNFHFLKNDKIDAYVTGGAGYGHRSFVYDSNDPNESIASESGLFPVALKIGAGMRYFFTQNIGLNVAVGLGQGGVINAGVSFKL